MVYSLLADLENKQLVEEEVRNILETYFESPFESPEHFNFRCNVCGDSKDNKFKRRGYIIKTRDLWLYYCHNCGYSRSVKTWMKTFFPSNYKTLMDKTIRGEKPDVPTYKNIQKAKPSMDATDEKQLFKTFKKIDKFPFCVEYCKSRKIPKEIYTKWYFAEDDAYKNRMIIPFYDNNGNIYYYQGRAMYSWMLPKYKSRKGSGWNNVYNFYNVNRNDPVAVLEGPIDSIFTENSIGMTGLKIKDPRLVNFSNRFFLVDNDTSGKKIAL